MLRLIEIRSYKLNPGATAEFDALVRTGAIPLLLDYGMDVVAFGPSPHEADAYFLVRAFDSLEQLEKQQDEFYSSSQWVTGPRAQILSHIGSFLNTILWLDNESIDDIRRSNAT